MSATPQPSAGSHETGAARRSRTASSLRTLLTVAVLFFAIHLLMPQLGELHQGLQALRSGRWSFLIVALGSSFLVLVASAWMVRSSVTHPPGWGPAVATQIAAGFASAVTPAGVGWFAVTQSSMVHAGTDRDDAAAAAGLNLALTVVAHVGLLLVVVSFLPTLNLPRITPPSGRLVVDAVVVAALVIGLIAWIPPSRRMVAMPVLRVLRRVPDVIRDPRRSARMAVGAVAQNLAYVFTLMACLAAYGASIPMLAVLVVYMVSATVAAVSPTPGGLGAMEASLVAGLTRVGVAGGQAVAATLTFRLLTFWVWLAVGAWMLRWVRARRWA